MCEGWQCFNTSTLVVTATQILPAIAGYFGVNIILQNYYEFSLDREFLNLLNITNLKCKSRQEIYRFYFDKVWIF